MKRSPRAKRNWREAALPWSRAARDSSGWLGRRSWRQQVDWSGSGVIAVPAPRGVTRRRWRGFLGRRTKMVISLVLVVALLMGGGWLWFRDSSFVAVKKVTVIGASGPEAAAISSALRSAALSMTTLDVRMGRLYGAVSAYPVVRSLAVRTQFPHGMQIHVVERLPVAMVIVAGHREAVAADGSLLNDLTRIPALPRIALPVAPGGPRLSEPQSVQELAAANAAPSALRPRIMLIRLVAGPGLEATLARGPAIYLGDATQLRTKWAAAMAVLADSGSAGAAYIDVSDPRRPAAGALPGSSSAAAGTGSGGVSATDTQPPPSVKGSAWNQG